MATAKAGASRDKHLIVLRRAEIGGLERAGGRRQAVGERRSRMVITRPGGGGENRTAARKAREHIEDKA